MTSSIVADTPKCPDCSAPMRLTRVLPAALPKDCSPKPASLCAPAVGQLSLAKVSDQQRAPLVRYFALQFHAAAVQY
jgi:hypothetical protein